MENKFELGIEISESVSKSGVPHGIRRYDSVPKKVAEVKKPSKELLYRYRPGVNGFVTEDFDV